jgi:hypothetical protein
MLAACNRVRWKRSGSNGTTEENQMRMKTLVVVGAISLGLLIAGCQAASQTPGPPGPQGATGATGDPGRDSDQRRAEEQKRADDQRLADQQKGADEQKRADDQKRADERAREGRDTTCGAGEHRYTNPNTGVVSCVRD